jgi:hypothetical protein
VLGTVKGRPLRYKIVDTDAYGIDSVTLDRNNGLLADRGVSRQLTCRYVPNLWHGRGGQTLGTRGQVRQGGLRPQERAPVQ